jgi:hypothetical protein
VLPKPDIYRSYRQVSRDFGARCAKKVRVTRGFAEPLSSLFDDQPSPDPFLARLTEVT